MAVHPVGIDLGTTYSAIAYINDLGKPEILPNREGEAITPSVVLFQGGMPLVGSMAKRSAAVAPDDVVQFVKRQMGNRSWSFEASDGSAYSPEEVSALIIKRLKEDAELILGEGTVSDAVITVPAYFDDARRRATMDAGRIAGVNVLRVINEPTAAALAYGIENDEDGTILVFDLGGGTFDVTVLRVSGGEFDILGTEGDRNLGGFDWDNKLIEHVNQRFQAVGRTSLVDDDTALADLRDKAELAKRSLTSVPKTQIAVTHGGVSQAVPVTREGFEELTAGLLSRTRHILENVLHDARLSWPDIDRILLVGGSTRMPMVRSMVEELAGKPAERSINPDEVVALGAAVQARLSVVDAGSGDTNLPALATGDPVVIRDVTSQTLGLILLDGDDPQRDDLRNFPIIERNTRVPAQEKRQVGTVYEDQRALLIEITEGEDADPEYVTKIGEQSVPIPSYPRGAPFTIVYSYDIDQIIHVQVIDETTKETVADFEVDNSANLGRGAVGVAAARMSGIEVA
ncbi:Hsp70 family protein [Phytoactinopolyspora mesophila]|uniref:Hsp70 family protein n=1 Tax=Phytoactinopolyspora mesophila TaxID=2650750 RepID=A0A7K3MAQ3_9ACTN|nr:Hsp70 family protein [Phytoactinopolyspora mesophila]NDL60373.1 Hsp70 family protein [Phytoactinopolyspora mesophila]